MGFVLATTLTAHYARWISFLGGDVREVGWIMGSSAVASLVLRPWLGQWINLLGPRVTWALGFGIFAVGTLGNRALDDLDWRIWILRACIVLGTAFVFASSLTYVSLIAPARRRTEAIGTLGISGFLGMLSGPYLGDIILGSETTRQRGDFDALFLTAAAALALPGVLLFFLRPPPVGSRPRPVRLGEFLRTVRRHWPGTILLVNAVFGLCMAVPFGFLADYADKFRLSTPEVSGIGVFFVGYAGCGIAVRLAFRRLPDRRGRRKVLLGGLVFFGAGMLCFLAVEPAQPRWLIVPGLVCGLGHGLTFHTMTSLTLESFPSHVRGTGSALAFMLVDFGMIAGAPILGEIAAAFGYAALFVTVGASCLATAAIYTASSIPVWRARRKRRLAGSPDDG